MIGIMVHAHDHAAKIWLAYLSLARLSLEKK